MSDHDFLGSLDVAVDLYRRPTFERVGLKLQPDLIRACRCRLRDAPSRRLVAIGMTNMKTVRDPEKQPAV